MLLRHQPPTLLTPIPTALHNASRRMLSSSSSSSKAKLSTSTTRRLPTPPMPRKSYDIVISEVETVGAASWWNNGNILITVGWLALLTVLVDRYLQRKALHDPDFDDVPLDKEEMVHQIVVSAQQQRRLLYQQYRTAPALYQCKVIQFYKMGGSHGLYNVKLDDIVEVLEENVGSKQAYHLCRLIRSSNDNVSDIDNDSNKNIPPRLYKNDNGDIIELGWYPITHLEKYTPPRKSWWKRLLFL